MMETIGLIFVYGLLAIVVVGYSAVAYERWRNRS